MMARYKGGYAVVEALATPPGALEIVAEGESKEEMLRALKSHAGAIMLDGKVFRVIKFVTPTLTVTSEVKTAIKISAMAEETA